MAPIKFSLLLIAAASSSVAAVNRDKLGLKRQLMTRRAFKEVMAGESSDDCADSNCCSGYGGCPDCGCHCCDDVGAGVPTCNKNSKACPTPSPTPAPSPAPTPAPFTPDTALGYWAFQEQIEGSVEVSESITWSSTSTYATSETLTDTFSETEGISVQVGSAAVDGAQETDSVSETASTAFATEVTDTYSATNGGSSTYTVTENCVGDIWQWYQNISESSTGQYSLVATSSYVCSDSGASSATPACPPGYCQNETPNDTSGYSDAGCSCCNSDAWMATPDASVICVVSSDAPTPAPTTAS